MKEALVRLLDGAVSANKTAITEKDFKRELKVILQEAHRIGEDHGRQEEKHQWKEKLEECRLLEKRVSDLQEEIAKAPSLVQGSGESRSTGSGLTSEVRPAQGGGQPHGVQAQLGSQAGLGNQAGQRQQGVVQAAEVAAKKAAAEAAKRL